MSHVLHALQRIAAKPATTTVASLTRYVCNGDQADARALVRTLLEHKWVEVITDKAMGQVVLLTELGEAQARGAVQVAESDACAEARWRKATASRRDRNRRRMRTDMPSNPELLPVWKDIARHGWTTPGEVARRTHLDQVGALIGQLMDAGFLRRWPAGSRRYFYATHRPNGGADVFDEDGEE